MITNFLKQVNGYSGNNVIVEKQIVLKSSCTGEGGGCRSAIVRDDQYIRKISLRFSVRDRVVYFRFVPFLRNARIYPLKKQRVVFLNNAKM